MPNYPTKEEILANPPENIPTDIRILCDWKDMYYKQWKEKSLNTKWACLEALVEELAKHYSHPCRIEIGNEAMYKPETHTIIIDEEKPSIISTLHEFGHHLYGESELKACSYAVWMFKTVFPKIYKKMNWEGHMLKM